MKISGHSALSRLLYKTRTGMRGELLSYAKNMVGTGGAIYTVNPMIMTGALDDGELYSISGEFIDAFNTEGIRYRKLGVLPQSK